jgi:hypothetical protein
MRKISDALPRSGNELGVTLKAAPQQPIPVPQQPPVHPVDGTDEG